MVSENGESTCLLLELFGSTKSSIALCELYEGYSGWGSHGKATVRGNGKASAVTGQILIFGKMPLMKRLSCICLQDPIHAWRYVLSIHRFICIPWTGTKLYLPVVDQHIVLYSHVAAFRKHI